MRRDPKQTERELAVFARFLEAHPLFAVEGAGGDGGSANASIITVRTPSRLSSTSVIQKRRTRNLRV